MKKRKGERGRERRERRRKWCMEGEELHGMYIYNSLDVGNDERECGLRVIVL